MAISGMAGGANGLVVEAKRRPPNYIPSFKGCFRRCPKTETEWAVSARVKWLQTAANVFDLIYKGDGGIKIEMAMAQRSPRPSD
jgi:hypothetical protein